MGGVRRGERPFLGSGDLRLVVPFRSDGLCLTRTSHDRGFPGERNVSYWDSLVLVLPSPVATR